MSLKERRKLEEIESESLLRQPQWQVKDESVEAEVIQVPEEVLREEVKATL